MADISVTLFGPLDTMVGPYIEYVLLVLAVLTLVTRRLENSRHVEQAAEGGADAVSRHPVHWAAMWVFVLASLYYLTLHHHSGMVLSVLVLGTFVTDFFEFESRLVEARNDFEIEAPKAAIFASVITLLYAAYVSVFFLIKPYWNLVI